jgi:hypothetical protein
MIARSTRAATSLCKLSALALWFGVTILAPLTTFAEAQTVEQKAPVGTPASPSLSPKQARSAQIDADTERLVQLAEGLQAEFAKSGKDTLSLEVVKKASEVEKLAKSLKERLKRE